jgi:hypothetical protein
VFVCGKFPSSDETAENTVVPISSNGQVATPGCNCKKEFNAAIGFAVLWAKGFVCSEGCGLDDRGSIPGGVKGLFR